MGSNSWARASRSQLLKTRSWETPALHADLAQKFACWRKLDSFMEAKAKKDSMFDCWRKLDSFMEAKAKKVSMKRLRQGTLHKKFWGSVRTLRLQSNKVRKWSERRRKKRQTKGAVFGNLYIWITAAITEIDSVPGGIG